MGHHIARGVVHCDDADRNFRPERSRAVVRQCFELRCNPDSSVSLMRFEFLFVAIA